MPKPLYTDQEIFLKVANHLLSMKYQSKQDGGGGCAYRGKDGARCAAGVLIPDKYYHAELEGRIARSIGYFLSRFTQNQVDLICALQAFHDNADNWTIKKKGLKISGIKALKKIGSEFNIKFKVVDNKFVEDSDGDTK
jgi:hypothetical protein